MCCKSISFSDPVRFNFEILCECCLTFIKTYMSFAFMYMYICSRSSWTTTTWAQPTTRAFSTVASGGLANGKMSILTTACPFGRIQIGRGVRFRPPTTTKCGSRSWRRHLPSELMQIDFVMTVCRYVHNVQVFSNTGF